MNTDVHEYVSKSKRSCTVYLYYSKGAGNSIVPPLRGFSLIAVGSGRN